MQRNASLCTKRREGVFRLRLKRYKFCPEQSNSYTDETVKIYYKVWTNIQSTVQFSITIFCKDNANVSKLCTGRLKEKLHLSNLQNVLWVINLRHRYPADRQWYEVKVIIRIKASNRYEFRTGLSRFRASSPANSRPPLAQI
jgi:hypothetical protein